MPAVQQAIRCNRALLLALQKRQLSSQGRLWAGTEALRYYRALIARRYLIRGRVQGVGFRDFTQRNEMK